MSGFLTVAAVAEDLGVSPRTILRWVNRGELEALRLPGGRLRIPQSAYTDWIASHMASGDPRTLAAIDEGGE
jgi:excisionase family DNA binding protein